MFKVAVAVLLTTMVALLIVIGKQHSEAPADRQPFDRDRLAEQLKNTVTRIGDRVYFLCGRTHAPKCEDLREESNELLARIAETKRDGSDEDLRSLSRFVARFEIDTAANIRELEKSAEFFEDLQRQLLEACDRYPFGDPNRPDQWICDKPR